MTSPLIERYPHLGDELAHEALRYAAAYAERFGGATHRTKDPGSGDPGPNVTIGQVEGSISPDSARLSLVHGSTVRHPVRPDR